MPSLKQPGSYQVFILFEELRFISSLKQPIFISVGKAHNHTKIEAEQIHSLNSPVLVSSSPESYQ